MIDENIYNNFLEKLLEGNKNSCIDIVKELISRDITIQDLYYNLFHKSMYFVGDLWESNKISVATEHLATSIIETLITYVYSIMFSNIKKTKKKKVIISCVLNEYHQLGAKMIADIFELNNWDSFFLGANTPIDSLFGLIEEKNPDIIGLSLSVTYNFKNLLNTIEEIQKKIPDKKIIIGGQAFRYGGFELVSKYDNVDHINSIIELENYIKYYGKN